MENRYAIFLDALTRHLAKIDLYSVETRHKAVATSATTS